ncbi:MAG: peptidylprolyl isomerase [Actinobacteria bacterium]|nr:peptidylprolyl isomerase [Actinomycetota bacterium]
MSDFPAEHLAERTTRFPKAPDLGIDPEKRFTAVISTSKGDITVALAPERAPNTVNSFVYLARNGYYDGLIFHRIIPGFMAQGGCPEGSGSGGPGYQFADELPAAGRYEIGSLAMANAGPNTNGSQFFIISGQDGVRLPPLYSLFGQVIQGLDVLAAIEAAGSRSGAPTEQVTINSVRVTEADG